MKTTVLMVLTLAGWLAASQMAVAQGYGSTNRYGGAAGGDRYGGSGGAGARYGGGAGRTTPAQAAPPGRGGSASPTGRGVAPAPLTRAGAGHAGQMGRSYQTAPIAAPAPTAPAAPAIPSDAVPFSNLPTDAKFFFLADANRSFLWVKISESSASNTVNQKVAPIPAATYVRIEADVAGSRPASPGGAGDQPSVDSAFESRYGIKNRRMADSTNAPAAPPAGK